MKKFIVAMAMVASVIGLSGCANDTTLNGKTYEPFGVVNDAERRDPNVVYEISAGSVIVAVIFCETVIIPIYVVGWDLYEPVRTR
jgi:hypothetical protein